MWRLKRPGYGHPASGHLWCETLRKWLLTQGWTQVGRPGKGSLFYKGKCLLASYVDDLKLAGPAEEQKVFWGALGGIDGSPGAFNWKAAPEILREFLGARYTRFRETRDGVEMDILHIDLEKYIIQTVEEYERLWYGDVESKKKKKAKKKPTPAAPAAPAGSCCIYYFLSSFLREAQTAPAV